MSFDELCQAVTRPEPAEVTLPESWAQGRSTFGGLVAALALVQINNLLAEPLPLRSLMVSFIAPATPGGMLTFRAGLLREGRSVIQAEASVLEGEQTVARVMASFGRERESVVHVPADRAPDLGSPEAGEMIPAIPGVTPAFIQHIEMRFTRGGLPFSGNTRREMGGWMRFCEPPASLTDAHLVALIDAWPPALLPHLNSPTPASSLTWNLEFLYPRPRLRPDAYLAYRAHIDQAANGYGHVSAGIWDEAGTPVALSRQTVTVFG